MNWIKSEEELPELEVENASIYVLVATNFNSVWEANYCYKTQCWRLPISGDEIHSVTHWMPLPEPPQTTRYENNNVGDTDKDFDVAVNEYYGNQRGINPMVIEEPHPPTNATILAQIKQENERHNKTINELLKQLK